MKRDTHTVPTAIALGHVVLDDVYFADGTTNLGVLGGAGAYAALGQAMVVDRTAVVSGIGADFPPEALQVFEQSGVDTLGLAKLDPLTPRTLVEYFADGEREETSQHGAEHFNRLDPTWALLPKNYKQAPGLYVFDAINPPLWENLSALRSLGTTTVLWEIRADICMPDRLGEVIQQLSEVDILSLNRTELRGLTGIDDLDEALAVLSPLVPVVALRLGSGGAVVAVDDVLISAKPPNEMQVIDQTGAGNAFSGAFVAAWGAASAGLSPREHAEEALRAAMAAAAVTISSSGAKSVSNTTRAEVAELARRLDIELPVSIKKQNGF